MNLETEKSPATISPVSVAAAKRQWLRPFLGAFLASSIMLAVCLLSCISIYKQAKHAIQSEVRDNLVDAATNASLLIDGDKHRNFTSRDQEKSSAYAQAIAPLGRMVQSNAEYKFIYTCILDSEGKVRFVLDPTPEGDADKDGVDDKSHILQEYPEGPAPMREALRSGKPVAETEPYRDQWGSFLSGYAPVFDSQKRLVGVVGVDMSAKTYLGHLKRLTDATILGMGTGLLLSLCSGTIVFLLLKRMARAQIALRESAARHRAELEQRVEERTAELVQVNDALHTEMEARAATQERLIYQRLHDALTDLPNRFFFFDHLERILNGTEPASKRCTVFFADLDNFKVVNESLGPEFGDELLKVTARRLKECVGADATVARLGGDEFCLLLEGMTDATEMAALAEKLLETLSTPVMLSGRNYFPSASIGIALSRGKGDSAGALMRAADTAMHAAKTAGKSGYAIYHADMNTRMVERVEMEVALRGALEREEFHILYQPLIDLGTGHLTGVEALLRWERPGHGLISPVQFIPIAEQSGLIVPIGYWVLDEVCRQARAWRDQLPDAPCFTVNVNLSGKQLQGDDVVERVEQALLKAGLSPHKLKIEITESVMMTDMEDAVAKLGRMKALGVKLALDDFGTGYSSMSSLHTFPLDTVKIDRSFVQQLDDGGEASSVIGAIVQVARSHGMDVTAEGVETEEQVVHLQGLGCDIGQGFYFARPLPPDDIAEALAKANGTYIKIDRITDLEMIERYLRSINTLPKAA